MTIRAATVARIQEMFHVKLALSAKRIAAVAVEDGVELTVTAKSYVRDLFCMADKVDVKVSVAEGMVSLLSGESVVLHIATADVAALAAPGAFAAANVPRSANDPKREW